MKPPDTIRMPTRGDVAYVKVFALRVEDALALQEASAEAMFNRSAIKIENARRKPQSVDIFM